jgi:hypothetical protein
VFSFTQSSDETPICCNGISKTGMSYRNSSLECLLHPFTMKHTHMMPNVIVKHNVVISAYASYVKGTNCTTPQPAGNKDSLHTITKMGKQEYIFNSFLKYVKIPHPCLRSCSVSRQIDLTTSCTHNVAFSQNCANVK